MTAPNRNTKCPRCGYDQRGVIATWEETCPLDGVCSECGLTFAWAEILNPILHVPSWCVESKQRLMAFPIQAARTLSRTLLPWRLWQGIRMSHPPNWKRLIAYLAMLLIWIYLVCAVVIGRRAVQELRGLSNPVFGPTVARSNAWQVFATAAGLPLSNQPVGFVTVTTPGGMTIQNNTIINAPGGTRIFALSSPRSILTSLIRYSWKELFGHFAVPFCCTVAFAVLPISRKRAKVKALHIIRCGVYCMGIAWCASTMMLLLMTFHRPSRMMDMMFAMLMFLVMLTSLVILLSFWWGAARTYLRMQHSFAVALSVTILGVLTPISIGGAIWYLFDL